MGSFTDPVLPDGDAALTQRGALYGFRSIFCASRDDLPTVFYDQYVCQYPISYRSYGGQGVTFFTPQISILLLFPSIPQP